MPQTRSLTRLSTLHRMILAGLFTALGVVLSRFLSVLVPIAGLSQGLRISLGMLPVQIAGLLLGPLWGAAVGVATDLLGCVIFPIGAYFPGYTLTNALFGALPGLMLYWPFLRRRELMPPAWAIIGAEVIIWPLCSTLNTLWLIVTASTTKTFLVLWGPRMIAAAGNAAVYALLMFVLSRVLKRIWRM